MRQSKLRIAYQLLSVIASIVLFLQYDKCGHPCCIELKKMKVSRSVGGSQEMLMRPAGRSLLTPVLERPCEVKNCTKSFDESLNPVKQKKTGGHASWILGQRNRYSD